MRNPKPFDTALIYAAGFGTRMGALTKDTPKPLLCLDGEALIDRIITNLRAGGVGQFHINTHYRAADMRAHFANAPNIALHDEPDGPYDTGGTLKALAPLLPPLILTANSDVLFFGENPGRVLARHWREEIDALLLLAPRARLLGHEGAGDFFHDDGGLRRRGDRAHAPLVYCGMQIIRPALAQNIGERIFSNNMLWDQLIESGRIDAAIYEGECLDIGNQKSLELARERSEHWGGG